MKKNKKIQKNVDKLKKIVYHIKAVAVKQLSYNMYGLLAQVVEHLTFNQVVPRSSRG